MGIFWQIVLQLVLIALNAVFACAEIAVISINDAKLAKLAQEGDKRAIRLAKLTSQPARFLATIQVAITLAGFLGSAFAADYFAELLTEVIVSWNIGLSPATIDTIALILITLILSYLTLVFGELVPKRVAMKKAETLALGMSGLISFISKVFAPLVWLLTASTNCILKLFGIDPNEASDNVTEEEIRMMIDVGSENGTIEEMEKEMLQNVFEFYDVTVGEIATHRTQVDMLWMDDSEATWEHIIHESRHSFYPVCQDSADDIVAILDAKDYFRNAGASKETILQVATEPPHFVPETLKAEILFSNMKKTRNHFAVVLDEYGGVVGIVTMNDLIEEIVGDFAEEDDKNEPIFEKIDEKTWRMSGSIPLDVITDELGIELPNDEFDTLGGLIMSTQTSVPDDGTQFECEAYGLHIDVIKVNDHLIEEAIVTLKQVKDNTQVDVSETDKD
ncbi:MAG: HlyC/CorC family transporter [Eubacteriales bacterium]|nr:HlyC/CorC family transporter [Eubacteriales bacterium]MCI7570534.1 hemolysin family protein [Clostridiales bacterium]MDD7551010.1 hemolysin family protein [Clostridia bacterium]MDY5754006.1 hemolysin family protein [Eubacteriales bacterium]